MLENISIFVNEHKQAQGGNEGRVCAVHQGIGNAADFCFIRCICGLGEGVALNGVQIRGLGKGLSLLVIGCLKGGVWVG